MIDLIVHIAKEEPVTNEDGYLSGVKYWYEKSDKPLACDAIRRISNGGGVCFEARDSSGNWHWLYKKDNKGVKFPLAPNRMETVLL